MREDDISSPEQLDAALGAHALRRNVKLWKAAEGRLQRSEILGLGSGALLLVAGLAMLVGGGGFTELIRDADGVIQIALAMLLIASFLGVYIERRLNALLELVKRLEKELEANRRS